MTLPIADIISWVLIAAGSFFVMTGSIGLVRMPDVFTRLHAASVVDSVGAACLLGGMMVQAGFTLVTLKLVILLVLLFFTSPVATHAVAQAAMHDGVEPVLDEGGAATQAKSKEEE